MNNTPTFISKLRSIVDDPITDHAISWDKKGMSFHVYDITCLSRVYLPNYFKHNNYSSFVRQLNMYGFRKVNRYDSGNGLSTVESDDMEFQHPFFLQDAPDLMAQIQRRQTPTSSHQNGVGSRPAGGPSSSNSTSGGVGGSSSHRSSSAQPHGGGGGNAQGGHSDAFHAAGEQLDLIMMRGAFQNATNSSSSSTTAADPFVFPQLYEILLQMNDRLMSTEKRVVQLESNRSQMRTEIIGLKHRLNLHINFTKNLVNMLLSNNPNLPRFSKRLYPSLMSTASSSGVDRALDDLLDEIHHRPIDSTDTAGLFRDSSGQTVDKRLSPTKKPAYPRQSIHLNGNFVSPVSVDCGGGRSRVLALPFTQWANSDNLNSEPATTMCLDNLDGRNMAFSTDGSSGNHFKRLSDPPATLDPPVNFKRMKTSSGDSAINSLLASNMAAFLDGKSDCDGGGGGGGGGGVGSSGASASGSTSAMRQLGSRHSNLNGFDLADLFGADDAFSDIDKNDMFPEFDTIFNDADSLSLDNLMPPSNLVDDCLGDQFTDLPFEEDSFPSGDDLPAGGLFLNGIGRATHSHWNRNQIVGNEIIPFDGTHQNTAFFGPATASSSSSSSSGLGAVASKTMMGVLAPSTSSSGIKTLPHAAVVHTLHPSVTRLKLIPNPQSTNSSSTTTSNRRPPKVVLMQPVNKLNMNKTLIAIKHEPVDLDADVNPESVPEMCPGLVTEVVLGADGRQMSPISNYSNNCSPAFYESV